MSADEQELQRLMVELRVLEGTIESLRSRISLVAATLNDLNLANMTLEGIAKEKVDSSIYVPIGGGSYIKARLESTDEIIYGVGAGVSIVKTIEVVKESTSNRISQLNKTRQSLEQQLSQVLNKVDEDQNRFRELSEKLQR
ncbi:MAG: prefoldin subunit alpha [Candidatus Bathyarchaeota archaeon]|nr:prefoldin subunit alpha [Candidatus Bathyarchaeota archaeon]